MPTLEIQTELEASSAPDPAQVCSERRPVLLLGRLLPSEHEAIPRKLLGGRGKDVPCAEMLHRPCAEGFHSLFILSTLSGGEMPSFWDGAEVLELVHRHTIMIMVLTEVYDSFI